jgi:hypothetical protein
MKINKKALELIEKGLSSNTVSKLTESQVQILHSKLFISEQVTEVPNKKTYKVGPKGGKIGNVMVSTDPNTKEVIVTTETEMFEDDDFDLDADQSYTGQQGSHDEYQAADDGMDDDTSPENHDSKMIGMSEEKNKPNPWAICHSQVGPKKSRKWERCVKEVKKQLGEGKNPVSLFIESQIMKIVEKNLPPRITKGDLIRHLSEQGPATAPTKPATKPTTKPGTKPRPKHPGQNPNPGVNPAPKAGKISPEDAKDKVIDVILNLLKK